MNSHEMTLNAPNTYHLSCKVVEIIYKDGKRMIKAMCNPGALIIETPDDGNSQLGDMLLVTGTFHIEKLETEI